MTVGIQHRVRTLRETSAHRVRTAFTAERHGDRWITLTHVDRAELGITSAQWSAHKAWLSGPRPSRALPPLVELHDDDDSILVAEETSIGEPLDTRFHDWATAAMFAPIAKALAAAHAVGVRHGNLRGALRLYATGLHVIGLGPPRAGGEDDIAAFGELLRGAAGESGCAGIGRDVENGRMTLEGAERALIELAARPTEEHAARAMRAPASQALDLAFDACVFYVKPLARQLINAHADALRAHIERGLLFAQRGMLATFPVVELLTPLLRSRHADVRLHAVRVLQSAADPSSTTLLEAALEDTDVRVATVARRALARLWPAVVHPEAWASPSPPPLRLVVDGVVEPPLVGDTRTTIFIGGLPGADVTIADGGRVSAVLENLDGRVMLWSVENGISTAARPNADWAEVIPGASATVGARTSIAFDGETVTVRR